MKKESKSVLGTWVQLGNENIVEIIGYSNFDFVIIDLEHGNITLEKLEHLIRAARVSDLYTIVRVYENNSSLIMRVLNLGIDAILVPQISSKEDAEKIVNSSKYPPLGCRGSCPCIREAGHWDDDWVSFMKDSNKNVEVIALVEGEEGLNNFSEIVAVEGIDSFMIGPFDLSVSLGIAGQVNHDIIEKKYKEVISLASSYNKEIIGVDFSYELDGIKIAIDVWLNRGVKRVVTGIDKMFFTKIINDVSKL